VIGWRFPFMLPVFALPPALLVQLFLKNPEPYTDGGLVEYQHQALRAMWSRNAVELFLLTMLTLIILYGPFVTYVPLLLLERFAVSPAIIAFTSRYRPSAPDWPPHNWEGRPEGSVKCGFSEFRLSCSSYRWS
jgi:hypothetical protein